MYYFHASSKRTVALVAALFFLLFVSAAHGQQPSRQQSSDQTDDVIRIKTELVQTDLMVFDKQGRFVDGLRPEQFELSVDGKPQTISFFERVATGSATEAKQLAAARGASSRKDEQNTVSPVAQDRQRLLFFFLDDIHLSASSLTRARQALADFVEHQMAENDQIAIVSTSGQIGFLQQLTDNKVVLQTAIARLNNKPTSEVNAGKTQITEFQANQVAEHNDRDLFNYLVSSLINEYQLIAPKGGDSRGLGTIAANIVENRTRQIEAQSKVHTLETLSVLEGLLRSSAQLAGRKLVFFISDGFITDVRNSSSMTLLKRVTAMAARVSAVVYTMDAQGTFNDPAVDATREDFLDAMGSGVSARKPSLDAASMQEPLHILAEDTGGRAILNSNSFTDAFQQAINETSSYYLLAWRPETDEQRNSKARIKVSIKDHSDLRVRLRYNYYVPPPTATAVPSNDEKRAPASSAPRMPETGLLTALGSLYPQRTIPTTLSAGYVNTPDKGLALKASMQIDRASLSLTIGEEQKVLIDVLGAAIDDRGVIVTFKQILTVTPDPSTQDQQQPVVWNQQLKIPPGLYQVRVAVRERASGRTGSAQQWLEVPDLSGGRLQISSLFLGERKAAATDEKFATAPRPVSVDVDHRFARTSVLRFQTYVYNAARGASAPDVWIQTQVLRDGRQVVAMPEIKVPTEDSPDQSRLPYWAEVGLQQLPAGRYVLQVTATDRTSKTSASQRVSFVIE